MSQQTTAGLQGHTVQSHVKVSFSETMPEDVTSTSYSTLRDALNPDSDPLTSTLSMDTLEQDKIQTQTEASLVFTKTLNTTTSGGENSHDNLIWNLVANGEMDLGLLAASLGILLAAVVMVSLYLMMRSKRFYSRIPSSCEGQDYEYIYKPLAGGALDEEYENTFVGVSIPLIQDVSKV